MVSLPSTDLSHHVHAESGSHMGHGTAVPGLRVVEDVGLENFSEILLTEGGREGTKKVKKKAGGSISRNMAVHQLTMYSHTSDGPEASGLHRNCIAPIPPPLGNTSILSTCVCTIHCTHTAP